LRYHSEARYPLPSPLTASALPAALQQTIPRRLELRVEIKCFRGRPLTFLTSPINTRGFNTPVALRTLAGSSKLTVETLLAPWGHSSALPSPEPCHMAPQQAFRDDGQGASGGILCARSALEQRRRLAPGSAAKPVTTAEIVIFHADALVVSSTRLFGPPVAINTRSSHGCRRRNPYRHPLRDHGLSSS
jgi:hypothetical protein